MTIMNPLSMAQSERILGLIADVRDCLEPAGGSGNATVDEAQSAASPEVEFDLVIQTAKAALRAERSAAAEVRSPASPVAARSSAVSVRAAARVLEETILSYSNWSARRLAQAEGHLRPFEGLPVDFDILALMGVDASESAFCHLIAWLLDPEGSHGMGDAFLRLFLARLGLSLRGRVFDYSRRLSAEVLTEVSWDVPGNESFRRIEEEEDFEESKKTCRCNYSGWGINAPRSTSNGF